MNEHPLVLALDIAGNPMRWLTYQDACYYYAKELIAWSQGEFDYTIYGGHRQLDGERSSLTLNTIIAVKGEMSTKARARSHAVPLSNRTLFRRDRHICAYCGHDFVPNRLTRDHVIPSSQGGKNLWTNVVTACSSCNKNKDNQTPEEAGMHLLYVPYAPNRNEYLILQNRNILADQMELLLKGVPIHRRLYT